MTVKFYTHPSLPTVWVAVDADGDAWIVWASRDGWSRRRPYSGIRDILELAPHWATVGIDTPPEARIFHAYACGVADKLKGLPRDHFNTPGALNEAWAQGWAGELQVS